MFITKTTTTGKRHITLLLFCVFFFINLNAQINKYYSALIIQHDGTQIECFAKYPSMLNSKIIKFKTDQNSKTFTMKSAEIKTVRYFLKDNKTIEKEFLGHISSFDMNKNFAPVWMDVLAQGQVTLYSTKEISKSSKGLHTFITYHYYCKRENEKFATKIAYVSSRNNFLVHKIMANEYFADTPDILEKIENKVDGYSAKEIMAIIEEYNRIIEN